MIWEVMESLRGKAWWEVFRSLEERERWSLGSTDP